MTKIKRATPYGTLEQERKRKIRDERSVFVNRLRYLVFTGKISRKGLCEATGITTSTMNNIFAYKPFGESRQMQLLEATGLTERQFNNIKV